MIQRQKLLLLYVSEMSDELNEPLGPLSTNCPSQAVAVEMRVMISPDQSEKTEICCLWHVCSSLRKKCIIDNIKINVVYADNIPPPDACSTVELPLLFNVTNILI